MHVFPSLSPTILSYLTIKRLKTSKMYLKKINNNANIRKTHPGGHCKFSIGPLTPDLCSLTLQTQEREAKAEMRRKAKELAQLAKKKLQWTRLSSSPTGQCGLSEEWCRLMITWGPCCHFKELTRFLNRLFMHHICVCALSFLVWMFNLWVVILYIVMWLIYKCRYNAGTNMCRNSTVIHEGLRCIFYMIWLLVLRYSMYLFQTCIQKKTSQEYHLNLRNNVVSAVVFFKADSCYSPFLINRFSIILSSMSNFISTKHTH